MMESKRKELFDALMVGIPTDDPIILKEMEEMVNEDLNRIEPLIDLMVTEAFKAGRRLGRLKNEKDVAKCSNEPQR